MGIKLRCLGTMINVLMCDDGILYATQDRSQQAHRHMKTPYNAYGFVYKCAILERKVLCTLADFGSHAS